MPSTTPRHTLRRAPVAFLLALGLLLAPAAAATADASSTAPAAVQGPLVAGPLVQGPLVDLGSDAGTCADGSSPQTQQGLLQRQESCGPTEQQQSPVLGQQQQPAGG